jgi:antitoxin (DNA-binding transcriptional repressor) of toxin-antitoxin stability system
MSYQEACVKKIAAAKFKEQCLSILDNVDPAGLLITKHGKPVAKLFPVRLEPGSLIGVMRGRIKINGDTLSTGIRWDAES